MLDPAVPYPLLLTTFETYMDSCVRLAQERLEDFHDLEQLAEVEAEINRYPRLEELLPPQDIFILNDVPDFSAKLNATVDTILRGGVLWEHTCAGEATRLNMGTKYLLRPQDFTPEAIEHILPGGLPKGCPRPEDLQPHSLGRRHMLQQAWDLWQLALEAGHDPQQVLARQHLLIVVNQHTAGQILDDFREAGFYGFNPRQVLFMIQANFHGLDLKQGRWLVDRDSPRRLHNHGQMFMQTTMDGQLFYLLNDSPVYLSWTDYESRLENFADKVSYNIEDLDYLTMSLDLAGIHNALDLGRQGYAMVMEVVSNDPANPIKGGACYYDPTLRRNVMIESFQLKGVEPKDIVLLNKNVNNYPNPRRALSLVREQGLSMPISVKRRHLYFQPVQGDINFLAPTAFIRRAQIKPIVSWKSGHNTPAAFEAMFQQDIRPEFWSRWASELTGLEL